MFVMDYGYRKDGKQEYIIEEIRVTRIINEHQRAVKRIILCRGMNRETAERRLSVEKDLYPGKEIALCWAYSSSVDEDVRRM